LVIGGLGFINSWNITVASEPTSSPTTQESSISVRNTLESFVVDLDQDQMTNVMMKLERTYGLRIGFEDLDYCQDTDVIKLGEMDSKLKSIAATRPLSDKELIWSKLAQQRLNAGDPPDAAFDIVYWRQSGRFSGSTIDQLLDKLVEGGPYRWTKRNGTYYIGPKKSSALDFVVSIDITDKSLSEVVAVIAAQAPKEQPISMMSMGTSGESKARIGRLVLDKVPAWEALCRVCEAARPTMSWTLAGYHGGRTLSFNKQEQRTKEPTTR
jgi:hypothetical protein